MKSIVFLLIGFALILKIDISEVRTLYKKANESSAVTDDLSDMLSAVTAKDEPLLMAYKGAALTLKAKHAKGLGSKKSFFKEGASLLETAIEKEPTNIEIRLLRLSVQENAPRITGYKDNLEQDKEFIHTHYPKTKNPDVKSFVKGYVLTSELFTDAEKQLY
ncbi:hypothetical protein [Maribacter sp. 2210JD10-5]|uniref:hypothetical protein n=1 Tax=Maribacter sp. 2210JD10-5 TaxID=3386272 RepID=UPI0039BCDFC0